jgi:virulence factor
MLANLIDTYKHWRRNKQLDGLFTHSPCFAFLGVGQHSMDNLYPVLLNLGVRIKYIYSRRLPVAQQAALLFRGCSGVTDLSIILTDPHIQGVFICMKNGHQLPLVKECLQAGKYVFVEKPAVTGYAALQELMSNSNAGKCMIAFNKRFSPLNAQLKKQVKDAYSYHARYLTGSYPEGDAVTELFCHPVDNVIQFFGPVQQYYLQQHRRTKGSIHLQLLLEHKHATGMLELSTAYSWALFRDTLSCLTPVNSIEIEYPFTFRITPLGKRIAGVPSEKIFNTRMQASFGSYSATPPVAGNNPVVLHGYRDEVAYFVTQVMQGQMLEQATPAVFKDTFQLLDQVQQALCQNR